MTTIDDDNWRALCGIGPTDAEHATRILGTITDGDAARYQAITDAEGEYIHSLPGREGTIENDKLRAGISGILGWTVTEAAFQAAAMWQRARSIGGRN